MDFINEVLDREDITSLLAEMDAVLGQYKALTLFTQLNEGVLDNLSDDMIKQISQIQFRLDAVVRARKIITKMTKNGRMSKEEAAKHRNSIRKNRKSLSAALNRTTKRMAQFQQGVEAELEKVSDDTQGSESSAPTSDVDLRAYGRLAPFILRKAAEGKLDVDAMDSEKYGETIAMLQQSDLIDEQGKITQKGQAAWESYNDKKANRKNAPDSNRNAIDDLASLGSDDVSDLDDLDDVA